MEWWLLPLLGGLLALDQTSFGQFMVSRPLVGGTVVGWVLGEPMLGFLLGGIMELCFLPAVPTGGGQVPEGGPAVGVGVWAADSLEGEGGLALGLALGLLWAWLGSVSVHLLRGWNSRWVPVDGGGVGVRAGMVWRGQIVGLASDFLRGGLLCAGGMGVAAVLAPLLRGSWPLGMSATLAVLAMGGSLAVGGLLALWEKGGKRWRVFLAGCGLGVAWGVLT